MSDSQDYTRKRAFFSRVLTVYGRKPVLETLRDDSLQVHALHLADSNRDAAILKEIRQLAQQRNVELRQHSRAELSRISKNGKQDQGVALDILCPAFNDIDSFLADRREGQGARLLALDGITNPQNLGMIVRSALAGTIDGILLPERGSASLGPLVLKASAGTLYRAPIIRCQKLHSALRQCQEHGAQICALDANADSSLFGREEHAFCIYVLGNESEGVSREVRALADTLVSIPMRNQVESLNVAVTASLIAYSNALGDYLER